MLSKKPLSLSIAFLILLAYAPTCFSQSEKETRQLLEKKGSWQTEYYDESLPASGTYTYKLSFSDDGQSVVFSCQFQGTVKGKEVTHSVTKSCKLRHLNPVHVTIDDLTNDQPKKWDIIFRTTYDKAHVKVERVGQDFAGTPSFLDSSYICLSAPDEETAKQIAKAMSHLIKLHGGQASTKY